jgi:RNA binding exosome subunit
LSSKIPIAYIDVRVFAHATEDVDKVLSAVRNILPAELIDKVVFKKNDLAGHHGNPIVLFEARIKEKSASQAVFVRLSSSLSVLDKEVLQSEFKQHIDKANLYIRLDKQSAFLNELKLQPTDPIHVRVHFQKSDPEEIVSVCKRFGMLP